MGRKLVTAAKIGDVMEVKKILRANSAVNVNQKDNHWGKTALHVACKGGYDAIVTILLAHPEIDVNPPDDFGNTPCQYACAAGKTSCVRALMVDQRVKFGEGDTQRSHTLWGAAYEGHLDVIKWWIVSKREIDGLGGEMEDLILAATLTEREEVLALLERFKENPVETRHEVKNELGVAGESSFATPPLTSGPS